MHRGIHQESRGISDVIGYILLFGMILVVATAATTVGFGQISTHQQQEQVSTVENGFELLDRDIEAMQRFRDPKQQTPLNIQTGSIGYAETQTTITLGQRDADGFTQQNTSITTTPIRYRTANREVVYEAGLVFSNDLTGGILSRQSTNVVIDAERAVVPVVIINPSDSTTARSPSGELLVTSILVSNPQTIDDRTVTTGGDPIWIEIESRQAAGWAAQLDAEGFTAISRSGNTVLAKLSDGTRTPTTATLSTTPVRTDISS